MATRIASAAADAACNAVVDRIDAGGPGHLRIYSGSQPATPDVGASGTLLADFTLPNPAFGNSSGGVASANAIATVTAAADGTAGYFRVTSGGAAAVFDGACGLSGAEMSMNTTTITVGVNVQVTAYVVTMPTA